MGTEIVVDCGIIVDSHNGSTRIIKWDELFWNPEFELCDNLEELE